ncbi:MAG: voltage-dependent potassium channel subunit beta [Spirochaetaceae bacterium]|nr:MAG: voltage-dependent potassium channel subunit beta [Spirochaetaceae bacterium]
MEYRRLGSSGLKVSALSFGAWVTFGTQMDVENAKACMVAAYDSGVNFFDNAEAYAGGQAETIMGEVLKKTAWRRDSYIISSKVFFGAAPERKPTQRGLSRKHVVEACHQALERFGTEYLDLYFCHRPDPEAPIEETVFTMNDLIRQGKVLYWGTSEWSAQEIMQAYSVARRYNLIPPTMEQPQYNMFHRERFEKEYARLYTEIGLGTTIWSPLASGVLTGKYNDGIPNDSRMNLPGYEWLRDSVMSDEGKARIEKTKSLTAIATEIGTTPARLALAWCLRNPNVSTVITGASRAEQVTDNMKALEVVPLLTDDVIEKIESVLANKPK